jgi:putative spermidine/putrescine transport system ATP-binding protein
LTCPDGAVLSDIPIDALPSSDHEASIMVRPDRMRLKPIAAAEGPQSGLHGTVTDATFLGDAMHFTVATGWGEDIIVRMPLDAGPA